MNNNHVQRPNENLNALTTSLSRARTTNAARGVCGVDAHTRHTWQCHRRRPPPRRRRRRRRKRTRATNPPAWRRSRERPRRRLPPPPPPPPREHRRPRATRKYRRARVSSSLVVYFPSRAARSSRRMTIGASSRRRPTLERLEDKIAIDKARVSERSSERKQRCVRKICVGTRRVERCVSSGSDAGTRTTWRGLRGTSRRILKPRVFLSTRVAQSVRLVFDVGLQVDTSVCVGPGAWRRR